MSAEEELTSFEAELAALHPRSDALDRDQLMFLAGRASVGGRPRERGRLGRFLRARRPRSQGRSRSWFWPTATAAMTAAAAALLVMLLVAPRVEIVERIVEVPAERSAGDVPTAQDGQSRPLEAELRPQSTQPKPTPSRLAVALAGWLPSSDAPPPSLDSYPRLRDAVLARGLDSLPTTLPPATGGGRASDAVPSSYRNLRESLLEKQPAGKPSNRPARGVSFLSGAQS